MPATLKPIDGPIRERRKQLAREAARVYAEKGSLRNTAERLGVSHEFVARAGQGSRARGRVREQKEVPNYRLLSRGG